jgi:uncharacterized Fe-S radical SAM superfamily protein PflX
MRAKYLKKKELPNSLTMSHKQYSKIMEGHKLSKQGKTQLRLQRKNVDDINLPYADPSKEKRVLVRAPLELIEIIDELWRFNGYYSRNDLIVQALKDKANQLLKKGKTK